jgi:hypothetical protein
MNCQRCHIKPAAVTVTVAITRDVQGRPYKEAIDEDIRVCFRCAEDIAREEADRGRVGDLSGL